MLPNLIMIMNNNNYSITVIIIKEKQWGQRDST